MSKVADVKSQVASILPVCPMDRGSRCATDSCAWWLPYEEEGGECAVVTVAKGIMFFGFRLEEEEPKVGGTD